MKNNFIDIDIFSFEYLCPKCKNLTPYRYHSHYSRGVKADGARVMITIYRVRCQNCDTTHALIPMFLIPHKHYAVGEIESVITQRNNNVAEVNISGTDASDETIKNWWKWFQENAASWIINVRQKSASSGLCFISEVNNIWLELQEATGILWSDKRFTLPYLFFSHSFNFSSA